MEQEIWKRHQDFDGHEFSNLGRFRSIKTGQVLKGTPVQGHLTTILKSNKQKNRKKINISRIVGELFVKNNNPKTNNIVIHLDGNGLNSHYKNLKWSTTKETVEIAIKNKRRKRSNWERITDEQIIAIREEFNNTGITYIDLANKYNTNSEYISGIVRYKQRDQVQPERKFDFKINYLTGNELKNFLSNKNKIKPDTINKILVRYVNKPVSLKECALKFNVSYDQLKTQIKNTILPEIKLLKDEVFKNVTPIVKVSNYGRTAIRGKIENRSFINLNDKEVPLYKVIAEVFVENLNGYPHVKFIDGNRKNLKASNLIWINYFEPKKIENTLLDQIKNDYINSDVTYKELTVKTGLSLSFIHKCLKGIKKKLTHLCKKCNDTDSSKFKKGNYSICKKCESFLNKEKYNSLTEDEKISLFERQRKWVFKNTMRVRLSSARCRARDKGLEFDLTEDFILELFEKQNGRCYYSGLPLAMDLSEINTMESRKNSRVFSIDRLDSRLGYTKDNVVITIPIVNTMKNELSVKEFLELIEHIYLHNKVLKVFPKKRRCYKFE